MTPEDLPAEFPGNLFEPTLNSTNPIKNYPELYQCLKESHGIITDASPQEGTHECKMVLDALERRNIFLSSDREKSILIGYAGIIKLEKSSS